MESERTAIAAASAKKTAASSRPDASSPSPADSRGLVPLPLIIGVAGHRNLRPGDGPELEKQVARVLRAIHAEWTAGVPKEARGPIVVLTGLAKGADQLVARVALRLQIGAHLVVPLPMPQGLYERDFKGKESLDEFHSLLRSAESFVLPICEGRTEGEIGTDGPARNRQYEELGVYIAQNSYILLALWDGLLTDKMGGTSQVVHLKLHGSVSRERPAESLLGVPVVGPVYQIVTPRLGAAVPGDAYSVRVHYPDGSGWSDSWRVLPLPHLDEPTRLPVHYLRRFNADAVRWAADPAVSVCEEELAPSDSVPEDLRPLRRCFGIADFLACSYSKMWSRTHRLYLLLFLLVGLLLNTYFYLYLAKEPLRQEDASLAVQPVEWVLIGMYLAAIGGLWAVYQRAKRSACYEKYHDYRALAEGLRVQFFWRLGGVTDAAADHYMQYQAGELDWLRAAIRATSLKPVAAAKDGIQTLKVHWLKAQLVFFKSKVKELGTKNLSLQRWVKVFLAIAVAWGAAKVLAKPLDLFAKHLAPSYGPVPRLLVDLCLVLVATASTALAGVLGWRHLRGYAENSRRYAKMAPLYSLALSKFEVLEPTDGDFPKRSQAIVREVGREALAENAEWLLMHYQRKLDTPK